MNFLLAFLVSIPVMADFGFFTESDTLDDLSVPSRIFKIYTPADQYSSLPLAGSSRLVQGAKRLLESGEIDSVQYDAIVFQVDYCKSQKIDPCLMFLDVVRGTAFTAGKTGTVWTAFHNVSGAAVNSVGKLLQINGVKEISGVGEYISQGTFPVYLVNAHGERVIEPKLDQSNWAQNLAFPVENMGEFYQGKQPPAERDFLKFSIPNLNIEPLAISKDFTKGQAVSHGGFPDTTLGAKVRFGGLDSDGESFYYGQGVVLSVEEFYQRQNFVGLVSEEKKQKRSQQILTTGDAAYGHSGSPFLSDQGEVLGILVEYLPRSNPTPDTNTSFGPNFSFINETLRAL